MFLVKIVALKISSSSTDLWIADEQYYVIEKKNRFLTFIWKFLGLLVIS